MDGITGYVSHLIRAGDCFVLVSSLHLHVRSHKGEYSGAALD